MVVLKLRDGLLLYGPGPDAQPADGPDGRCRARGSVGRPKDAEDKS
jgi:hypothetical protein